TRRTQQTITILPPIEQEAGENSSNTKTTEADSAESVANDDSTNPNGSEEIGETDDEATSTPNDKDGE
ncbi:MAG: hypothetical protein MK324_17660, partial [Pirellulales bacterium]|nr:hypothetical protein [Pirellulales bacterium]